MQPDESQRAALAGLGLPSQTINQPQPQAQTEFDLPPLPAGGVQFQLGGYRGGPARFTGGGAGYRPLRPMGGQAPRVALPRLAYGATMPRPAPARAKAPGQPDLFKQWKTRNPTTGLKLPAGATNPAAWGKLRRGTTLK